MEAASAKLKRRIDAFEKHVASCRSSFDVGLLYRMLRIFSESQRSEITGLAALRGPQARGGGGGHLGGAQREGGHLGTGQRAGPSGAGHGRGHVGGSEGGRQLRGGQIGNGQGGRGHLGGPRVESSEVSTYLTWLAEYVGYLVALKKVFDERIFIPLCENLYLNEGSVQVPAPNRHCVGSAQSASSGVSSRPSTDVSSCDSQDSSSAEHHHQGHDDHHQHLLGGPQRSVPRIAECLFRLRKQWALLLRGDELRDEYFSAESGPALLHFQGCGSFYKVLRLVPDIFCKALRAARLCREWVDAHGATLATVHAIDPAAPGALSSELPQLEMSEMFVSRCDRVDELKRSVDSSKARLMALNEELEARRSERDLLEERLGVLLPGADDMGRVALQERLEVARSRVDVLGSAIRLERYRQRLLVGDWLAELESQPDRIRHADRV